MRSQHPRSCGVVLGMLDVEKASWGLFLDLGLRIEERGAAEDGDEVWLVSGLT